MNPDARWLRFAAIVAWSVSVLSYIAGVVLTFANEQEDVVGSEAVAVAIQNLAFVAIATLSVLILRAQPRNPVGWGIMLAGVGFPLEEFFAQLTAYAVATWGVVGLTLFAGWASRWVWILGTLAVPIILFYYPTGALTSPGWRGAVYTMWGLAITAFALLSLEPTPMEEFGDLPNPLGVEGVGSIPVVLSAAVFFGLFLVPLVLGAASLIPRYVRSQGVERQQMKVIAWVGVVAVLYFFVLETFFQLGPIADPIVSTVFTVFVGSAITAAIVRYRVFEIDRIISRTVSYAIIVALLGVVFATGVVWLPTTLGLRDSPLMVAGTTLLVAALFNPLRRRVQLAVDRRFNRSNAQAQLVTERFAAEMSTARSIEEISAVWVDTVNSSLRPEVAGIWLNHEHLADDT